MTINENKGLETECLRTFTNATAGKTAVCEADPKSAQAFGASVGLARHASRTAEGGKTRHSITANCFCRCRRVDQLCRQEWILPALATPSTTL